MSKRKATTAEEFKTDSLPLANELETPVDEGQQSTGSGAPDTTVKGLKHNVPDTVESLSLPSPKVVASRFASIANEVQKFNPGMARRMRAVFATLEPQGFAYSTAGLPLSGEKDGAAKNDFVASDQPGELVRWDEHEPKAVQTAGLNDAELPEDTTVVDASVDVTAETKTAEADPTMKAASLDRRPKWYVGFTNKDGKKQIATVLCKTAKEAKAKVAALKPQRIAKITQTDPTTPPAWKSLTNAAEAVSVSGRKGDRKYAMKAVNYGRVVELIPEITGNKDTLGSIVLACVDEDHKNKQASVEITDTFNGKGNSVRNVKVAANQVSDLLDRLVTESVKTIKNKMKKG